MNERRAILVLVDLALVNVAVLFALSIWALRGDIEWDSAFLLSQWFWFALLSVLWVVLASLSGLYEFTTIGSSNATWTALFRTVALVILSYFAIYFIALPNTLPRLVVLYHGAATIILIGGWRAGYANVTSRVPFRRRVLIVGAGWAGRTIACAIRENADAHFHVLGFVDDDGAKQKSPVEGLPVLGTRENLLDIVHEKSVAEVILAVTHDLPGEMFRILLDAQEQGVQITPMSVLFEQLTARVPVEHIGDSWYVALPLGHAGTGGVYPAAKRIFDVALATVGLVIFGAMLPFIALAIRLDSSGPIFYSQERVGKAGRVFRVRKLRTMVKDAERDGRAIWASSRDPRVTRVGRLLRKARVDEFPQLVNILRGEMSAVGPRPERPEFVAQLEKSVPFYRLRHAVKPGMAGWAVVNYDYVDSIESARVRVEYDLYYIKHQSLWLDILILSRMVGLVFALRGR
jgi:exopolysaccharide biosynthesis polyprenyl glycosylphosphotransferase